MEKSLIGLQEEFFGMTFNSQNIFNSLMKCMANPGQISILPKLKLEYIDEKFQSLMLPVFSLFDQETTFTIFCQNRKIAEHISEYICINTQSQVTTINQAQFVLALNPTLSNSFLLLKQGTVEKPHNAATIFYLVKDITEKPLPQSLELKIRGPGILEYNKLSIISINESEIKYWQQNINTFPLGVDIFIISESGKICGLPRSSSIELK